MTRILPTRAGFTRTGLPRGLLLGSGLMVLLCIPSGLGALALQAH